MTTAARPSRLRQSIARLRRRASTPADVAKRRVQASLLVLFVLLAAAISAGILSAASLYRSAENRYIRVALPLQTAVRSLEAGMAEEESGTRGYLITGDRQSLAPYFAGRTSVERDLGQITRLTRGRPHLVAKLALLRSEIVALHGYFDKLITFVADGRVGQRRARSEVLANEREFAGFQRTATQIQGDLNAFVRQTRASQHATYVRAVGTLAVAGFFGLAIAVTLLLKVPRRLRSLYAAEQEARQRAERDANAARALTHVSDAVVLVDDTGRVRSWNPAAERQFGAAAESVLGRDAADVVPGYARLLEAGAEFVSVNVDGEERWLAATKSTFTGGHVLTVRDVTTARALEQARSDFVATASHELRTPLTSIYGAAETLLGRLELPESRRRELLRIIEHESMQLARIVDQLLMSAQLTRGRVVETPAPCDLRALCEQVLASAEARRPGNVTLALVAPDELQPFWCDEALLRQVIGNLVDNALKYSPDGGRIELRLAEQPERVRIEVADEGLGIALSEQERIFEKFYRLDARMSRGIGGSGLGLHIAREIVEQMRGSISVRSVPGRGSTFAVTLPRLGGGPDAEPVGAAPAVRAGPARRHGEGR